MTDVDRSDDAGEPDPVPAEDGDARSSRRRALTIPLPALSMPPLAGRRWVLGGVGAILLAALVFCALGWRSSAADLRAARAEQADIAATSQVARDYTLRSLTYDHRRLDHFFSGVNRGATPGLRAKYREVRETLTDIMSKSQVVASGEVLGTTVTSKKPGRYEFLVFATQKTQNIQQPEPAEVPNLLKVTVVRSDDKWLVDDYASR
ncbi:hypothetical protein GOARA_005_00360 [Gordonia araii NBRC 100433]|uniref:Uncharacterized protein n=1 Tax=Gordonia araii NBRC 100433 TaxID=1073574 RepID=G7GXB6_9ACTN|nr:hypothetical protein [Gordonia araii]NNG99014.1 hypothetical protein [Gordonia araii NBRC 100433]GAB08241.1 hypothetical protein GOARA_005_00360 [Gordonia araii NBRC 100433]